MATEEEKEELHATHRKELKELRGRIQALKNNVPKGDKKRKKQAADDIAQLESDVTARHTAELARLEESGPSEANGAQATAGAGAAAASATEAAASTEDVNDDVGQTTSPPAVGSSEKLSKAQRRRLKKEQEAKERDGRFEEASKAAVNSDRSIELRSLTAQLESLSLRVHQVEADGNCLYYAMAYQLHNRQNAAEMKALRRQAANFMLRHRDDFEAFISEGELQADQGPPDEDTFERYCRSVAETSMWGGQLEIQALARALDRKVVIYQASADSLSIGDDSTQPPLRLVYHRHDLGSGEHYNAAMPLDAS